MIKQQDSVKKGNERRKIDYVKHFLLPGVRSIRITKIENKVDFPPFPFVLYSDVGTYNCANAFLSSDSANLKLSKCDNHGNLMEAVGHKNSYCRALPARVASYIGY